VLRSSCFIFTTLDDPGQELDRKAREVASLIASSTYAVAYTGAGISTSAGIGDYRGLHGAWTERKREGERPPEEGTVKVRVSCFCS